MEADNDLIKQGYGFSKVKSLSESINKEVYIVPDGTLTGYDFHIHSDSIKDIELVMQKLQEHYKINSVSIVCDRK